MLLFLNWQIFWLNLLADFIEIPNVDKPTVRGILGLVISKM